MVAGVVLLGGFVAWERHSTHPVIDLERAGSGSGLPQALRQVGGTIGVAILGTVLNSGYRGQLDASRLPGSLSITVRSSVAAGVQSAQKISDDPLLQSVRASFVHGMDRTLVVSAMLTLAGAILALLFLQRRTPRTPAADRDREESAHEPAS